MLKSREEHGNYEIRVLEVSYHDFTFIGYYLSGIHWSRSSRFSSGLRLAHYTSGNGHTRLLCRYCLYDHRHRHDHFQSAFESGHTEIRPRTGHRCQRWFDRCCTVWILHFQHLYLTLSMGRSIWSGGRSCRCRPQQLCSCTIPPDI